MQARLSEDVQPLKELAETSPQWGDHAYRRVSVTGSFDFAHEMVLRNRRHDDVPGMFVVTPLKLENSEAAVLVVRGFIPLEYTKPDQRKQFQREARTTFVGLVKEPLEHRLFAPRDPSTGNGWVDAWLRMDIAKMQGQIPYPLLPIYLEVMTSTNGAAVQEQIVTSTEGRNEIFFMPSKVVTHQAHNTLDPSRYPIPVFDTVVPPGRHLGYVYEWALMALITALVGLVAQLKPPRAATR